MDKKFITDLKTTPKLSDILTKYNVDYYIANNAKALGNGYFVEEPTRTHKYMITTVDTLNHTPLVIEGSHSWKFEIFDMRNKK